jgi:hypothetical protein
MRFVLAAVTGIVLFGTDCAGAQAQNSAESCEWHVFNRKSKTWSKSLML